MAGRLNWESASRADRIRRSGSESVYSGTSTGGKLSGSDIAVYAYEQAARRAAKRARKEDKKAAVQESIKQQKKANLKRTRQAALGQYIAEATTTAWNSADDARWEELTLSIARLIDRLHYRQKWNPPAAAAHAAVVTYMDALRNMQDSQAQHGEGKIFDSKFGNEPSDILVYLGKRVRNCGAKYRDDLYKQMDISLSKFGSLSNYGREFLLYRLIVARILVVTPSGRILYYARHERPASN